MGSYARPQEKDRLQSRPVQVLGLMAGSGGLLAGLFLLEREPLLGVLGMLGAMALVLVSLAKLCDGSRAE
ncbi:MAG TPA: hypothetical protein VMG82_01495 [Candidatus Sulfotelmatobacter sp.]|nr:hypothetical protein [Candidatus Sulfotelmatobacter sp.]